MAAIGFEELSPSAYEPAEDVEPAGSPAMMPVERSFPLAVARQRAEGAIARLGWRPQLQHQEQAGFGVATCELFDGSGQSVPAGRGAGKGNIDSAIVGALFESLEHVFSGSLLKDSLEDEWVEAAILGRGPLSDELVIEKMDQDPAISAVPCTRYRDIVSGLSYPVPHFLWAPWYVDRTLAPWRQARGDYIDYSSYQRFSVNTGTAIGATVDEALVHALNESIERDALSLFLFTVIFQRSQPSRPIAEKLLAPPIREKLHAAQANFDRHIRFFDITTDFDVPAVVAVSHGGPGVKPQCGSGASLFPGHAIERALSELVQIHTLAGAAVPDDALIRAQFSRSERLLACFNLEVPNPGVHSESTEEVFTRELPSLGVEQQLARLVERFRHQGCTLLVREVIHLPEAAAVVQVQVPGLERFMLILDGHFTAPGTRALTYGR